MRAGSFNVLRKQRAKSRWSDASVPEFEPCWTVRVRLPGGKDPREESSRIGICPQCMAVPQGKNPATERPDCRCLRPAVEFAKGRLQQMAGMWQAGRLEEMQAILRPKAAVTIGRVVDTYTANVPERARETARDYELALRTLLTQVTGQSWERCRDMPVTILTKELALDWMRLRQAWNLERELPEARQRSWDELRAALRLARTSPGTPGALPGLVAHLPLKGNNTINTVYGSARSLFGRKARSHHLPGLELPVLTFGDVSTIMAPKRGGGDQSADAVEGLLALGEKWRTEDLEKWIAFRLMITCGLRAVEVRWARRHWLQEGRWLDDEGREWRGWALVVKHYPDDPALNPGGKHEQLPGFWLKDKKSDKARPYRLEEDLLEVLLPRTGLLMAPDLSYTARSNLVYRTMSKEMRPLMGEGTKGTNHNLRKLSVSAVADLRGIDAAAAHGGHTRQVAETFYARSRRSLNPITDADLRAQGA